MKLKGKPIWLKSGIFLGAIFLLTYIVLVFINFNSYRYFCEPTGFARMADWIYFSPQYISPCMDLSAVIVPGIIWIIIGFILGFLMGLILMILKKQLKNKS